MDSPPRTDGYGSPYGQGVRRLAACFVSRSSRKPRMGLGPKASYLAELGPGVVVDGRGRRGRVGVALEKGNGITAGVPQARCHAGDRRVLRDQRHVVGIPPQDRDRRRRYRIAGGVGREVHVGRQLRRVVDVGRIRRRGHHVDGVVVHRRLFHAARHGDRRRGHRHRDRAEVVVEVAVAVAGVDSTGSTVVRPGTHGTLVRRHTRRFVDHRRRRQRRVRHRDERRRRRRHDRADLHVAQGNLLIRCHSRHPDSEQQHRHERCHQQRGSSEDPHTVLPPTTWRLSDTDVTHAMGYNRTHNPETIRSFLYEKGLPRAYGPDLAASSQNTLYYNI